jgi:hypothetical protein
MSGPCVRLMKIAIFDIEPREAFEFDALKRGHDLTPSEHTARTDNAAHYADAQMSPRISI